MRLRQLLGITLLAVTTMATASASQLSGVLVKNHENAGEITILATGTFTHTEYRPADNLILSGRNIPGLKVVDATQVNVYDVMDCRTLLISQEGLTKLEERLTP